VNNGFVLAAMVTPASHHDSPYLPCCTIYSLHTEQNLKTVYADKGYFGKPNRYFLNLNNIAGGIMRKDTTTVKFTPLNMLFEHLLDDILLPLFFSPSILQIYPD